MKNFNELFEEATIIADHRDKIFNQLIEKAITKIIPDFCKACQGFNIDKVFFKLKTKPNSYCDIQHGYEYNSYYVICFYTGDCTFSDAKFDEYSNTYEIYGNYLELNDKDQKWLKTGIVELINSINNRLESYNKKYAEKNIEVENLLK